MTIAIDPNPKQLEFFRARERFVAYGGARGGGKSWAIRQKARLLALRWSGIRILILRRSFPELQENHILPLLSDLRGLAQYRASEKAFLFPGGSRIKFGYCDRERDVDQYQGQEYDVIFLDEATQFTEYQYITLTPCIRGANDFPKRMYLTCNPGGVGHMWVKRLFVDRAFRGDEDPADYRFIPARATDNPVLAQRDPGYLKMLDNLPPGLREAWRDGSWEVFAGQYFPEFTRESHVVRPFSLPPEWPRYRAFDYGLDMLACYWFAIGPEGRVWVYRELRAPGLIVSQAAQAMLDMTPPEEHIQYTIAPPDMWSTQKDTGRTMAELFAQHGVPLVRASSQRIQGWMVLKEYLRCREDGRPGMLFFDSCPGILRDLPALQHDEKKVNDCAVVPHDITHGPDALRYFCLYRALGAQAAPEETERDEDAGQDYDDFMTGGDLLGGYLSYGGW